MVMEENSGTEVSTTDTWFSSSVGGNEIYDPAGALVAETWHNGTAVGSPLVVIDFKDGIYGKGKTTSAFPADGYAQVNQQIADSDFAVSGPTAVDGQSALELSQTHPNGSTTDIWVGTITYLPLQWVNTNSVITQTWDITWAPPAQADQAELAQPSVPAGFSRVPVPIAFAATLRAELTRPSITVPAATTVLPAATTTVAPATTTVPAATTTLP